MTVNGAPMNDATESQEAVFALLADPATHGGHAVKRIDTHAASVFLAGERALKVKRAVRFPFLDYSTLAKRKAACETELAINRRTAPGHLSPRGRDHARGGRTAGARRARRAGRMGGRDAPLRRAPDARPPRRGGKDRRCARRRARPHRGGVARRCSARPTPRAGSRALESYIDEHVDAFGERPDLFPPEANRAFAEAGRADLRADPSAAGRARAAGIHPPHPRRPAPRQYRPARRPPGAVRRDRVQRGHRLRRRALRSRLPADGPGRAQPRARRRTSCSTVTSSNPGATRTSMRWPRCRSSCRCGRRSAPR